MFNEFNKIECGRLRKELQEVLNKYGIDKNIEFDIGSMKFTNESVDVKITTKIKGGKSFKERVIDASLKNNADWHNLTTEVVKDRQLVGYNSRQYRYPFIYINVSTNQKYKCSLEQAKLYFSK